MGLLERVGIRRDTDREVDRDDRRSRTREVAEDRRGRRREVAEDRRRAEFGGINWGAAFFGWLVALGFGVVVTALAAAAGAALGLTEGVSTGDVAGSAEEISLIGAIVVIAIALVAYFAGGYVAGRMSRFDGGRQGFAAWLWGVIVAIVLAVVAAIAGAEYNVFDKLDLPRIPIDEGTLSVGGAITLAAAVLGALIASIFGGRAGERYHRKVDRAGYA
jgi:hypothetical protein